MLILYFGLNGKILKVVQTERDINSLLLMLRDMMEVKETTVSNCFRLGKEQHTNQDLLSFTFHLLGII